MSDEAKNVTIEDMAQKTLVAMARDFTMETRDRIPGLWQKWFSDPPDVSDAVQGAFYGVSLDADGSGAFRYAVGIEADPVPAALPTGTCTVTLSAGSYAILRVFGSVSDLPANFDWVFSEWLPASDHALRPGAVFERYPDDSRNGPDGMAYEIWVPVTPKT